MEIKIETIHALINRHVKRVLAAAELIVPEAQYKIFRKHVLDEFGRNGLESELERELKDG